MRIAGKENVLWHNIKTDKYFGIDIEINKGNNLNADTRKVFDNLNLSEYNIIDCDSYGIAFDLYKKILTRKDVRDGTIIFYTAITNEFTKIQNESKKVICKNYFSACTYGALFCHYHHFSACSTKS